MSSNNHRHNRNRSQDNVDNFGHQGGYQQFGGGGDAHHRQRRGGGGESQQSQQQQQHRGTLLPRCEKCGKAFIDENELQFHDLTEHHVEPLPTECPPAFPEFRFVSGEVCVNFRRFVVSFLCRLYVCFATFCLCFFVFLPLYNATIYLFIFFKKCFCSKKDTIVDWQVARHSGRKQQLLLGCVVVWHVLLQRYSLVLSSRIYLFV